MNCYRVELATLMVVIVGCAGPASDTPGAASPSTGASAASDKASVAEVSGRATSPRGDSEGSDSDRSDSDRSVESPSPVVVPSDVPASDEVAVPPGATAVSMAAPSRESAAPKAAGCDDLGEAARIRWGAESLLADEPISYLTNSANIRENSFAQLDGLAAQLCKNQQLLVEVGVHTDSRGSAAFNRKLSQARADAVRDYLIAKGIPPRQLLAVGYGESRPRSKGPAKNQRRTEFRIVGATR